MNKNKDQLVDEQAMEKMSVAPPDPEEGAGPSEEAAGDAPAHRQVESDTISGVADQDPLSAHPS